MEARANMLKINKQKEREKKNVSKKGINKILHLKWKLAGAIVTSTGTFKIIQKF